MKILKLKNTKQHSSINKQDVLNRLYMRFKLIFILIFVSITITSCSGKHTEEVVIDTHKSVFFNSEIRGIGGGHYKFTITSNRYFHKESRTIDFGDIGDLPILYELKDGKLIIHTYIEDLAENKMPDLISFIKYDSGIKYVQKLDSVKKGFITEVTIYYPMDFYFKQDSI